MAAASLRFDAAEKRLVPRVLTMTATADPHPRNREQSCR